MREILVDCKAKVEAPAFVHSLVRIDGKRKVEDVVRVGEVCFHGCAKGELFKIYSMA